VPGRDTDAWELELLGESLAQAGEGGVHAGCCLQAGCWGRACVWYSASASSAFRSRPPDSFAIFAA